MAAIGAGLTMACLFSPGMAMAETQAVTDPLPYDAQNFQLRPAASPDDLIIPSIALKKNTPQFPSREEEERCGTPINAACDTSSAFLSQDVPSALPANTYGPADQTASFSPQPDANRYRTFGSQLGAVKWEMAAILAYYTAINGKKMFEDPEWPHFHKEGWFGKNTNNVGMDKVAHSYSAYVLSEILYGRLKRKTNDAPGIAFTAAALGSAVMLYTELWDSIEPSAGWSWEDVTFNTLGAGFSVLRNSVPGLDKKLDFRMMIVPNSNIYTFEGKEHFEQQRYFFALKLSGFEGLNKGPLRFLELHAGYYAKDFTLRDRALGIEPKRRLFVGLGINLRELFFKNSRSRVGRAVGEGLDYFQLPYTAIRHHVTN